MEKEDISLSDKNVCQSEEQERNVSSKRQSVANRLYSDSFVGDGKTITKAIKDYNKSKKYYNYKSKKIVSKAEPISSIVTAPATTNMRHNYINKVEDSLGTDDSLDVNIHVATNKAQDDEEEKFIKSAIMIRNRLVEIDARKENVYASLVVGNKLQDAAFCSNSSVPKSDSGGLKGFSDLHAAVYAGMKESCATSLMELLDWDTPEVKKIGALCKVYWDGEDNWFDARILNYDKRNNKHYIFYTSDSTAEWISLSDESVLIAEVMCLVKVSQTSIPWPSQRFQMSEKAAKDIKSISGYRKDCVFSECFIEDGLKEYAFTKEKNIFPLQEDIVPISRRSKKFSIAMQAALAEQEIIDSVIETIFKALQNFIFEALKGPDWIYIRVRASTHRIEDGSVESQPYKATSSSSANSNAVPNLHNKRRASKTADDSALMAVDHTNSSAVGSSKHYQGTAFCVGTVTQYCPSIDLHLVLFDEPVLQPQWVCCKRNTVDLLVGYHHTSESTSSRPKPRPAEEVGPDGTCMVCSLCIDTDLCAEISKPPLTCQKCARVCHSYCVPPLTFPPTNPIAASAISSRKRSHASAVTNLWTCWNCIGCSVCKIELWDQPLMWWNINRVKSVFAGVKIDHPMLLCGRCMERYKHMKTFCPICFELYEDNPSDSTSAQGTPAVVAGKVDIDPMVQCNECFKWVHATCEGIDDVQYNAISLGTHPIWGDEYLCPWCRVKLASEIILNLRNQDTTHLFAEPVTTLVAKNYFDVIRNPMDLSTMAAKSTRGQYKSLQALRQDFELMCLNALVFNKVGDEYWREARSFFMLGSQLFDSQERKSHSTTYAAEIAQIFADSAVAAVDELPNDAPLGKKRKYRTKHLLEDVPNKRVVSMDGSDAIPIDVEVVAHGQSEQPGPQTAITTSSNGAEEGDSSQPIVDPPSSSAEQLTETPQQNENSDILLRCEQLPTTVTAPPDPRSCVTLPVLIQSSEDTFFAMAEDICGLCASAGSAAFLIFCHDCGEAFHSFCVDVPIAVLGAEEKLLWCCSNCKICSQCGTSTEDGSEGGRMIYCDRCDDAYHGSCLHPPLDDLPTSSEAWFCARCVCCRFCKEDKEKSGGYTPAWSAKPDMCIACHEVEKQVTEAINFIVSSCEQRAEGRVPDSSALYWMEESVTSEASPTAGEKADKAVDAAPDMQEEPSVKLESQQEALDASAPASVKRARLKKLKLEKALEEVLSKVIELSEEAEKEAKRSQIIAEFEAPNALQLKGANREHNNADNCKLCGLGSSDLVCSECSDKYHNHCRAGAMMLPFHYMHAGTSYQQHYAASNAQFICRFCVSRRLLESGEEVASSLSIAAAVLELQLFRVGKRREAAASTRAIAQDRMNSHWREQRISLEAILALATCRVQWFESLEHLSVSPSLQRLFRNESGGETSSSCGDEEARPAWLRHRAVRFMINWRRKDSRVRQHWVNRLRSGWKAVEIEKDGEDSEAHQLRLARLSAGAAAFIQCTLTDVPASQNYNEIKEVVKFLSCAYSLGRKIPDEAAVDHDEALQIVRTTQKSLLCPPIAFRDNRIDSACSPSLVGQSIANQQIFSEAVMFKLPEVLLHRSNMSSRATDAAKKSKSTALMALMKAQDACALRKAAEQAETDLQKVVVDTLTAMKEREKVGHRARKKGAKPPVLANLPKRIFAVNAANSSAGGAGASENVNESIDQFISICLECGPGFYGQKASQQRKTDTSAQVSGPRVEELENLYVDIQSSVKSARESVRTGANNGPAVLVESSEMTTAVADNGDNAQAISNDAVANNGCDPALAASSDEKADGSCLHAPMEVQISIVDQPQCREETVDMHDDILADVGDNAQAISNAALANNDCDPALVVSSDENGDGSCLHAPMEVQISIVDQPQCREETVDMHDDIPSLNIVESVEKVAVEPELAEVDGAATVTTPCAAEVVTAALKSGHDATYPMPPSAKVSTLQCGYYNYGAYATQGSSLSMSYSNSEASSNLLSTPTATAWVNTCICCMCKDEVEDTVVGRMMTLSNGSNVHLNCLRWSCGIETADGVLADAREAIERSLKQLCFLCRQRGAGLCCVSRKFGPKDIKNKKLDKECGMYTAGGKVLKCRRYFHVRCALACNVLMLETRKIGNGSERRPHDIHLLCFCPEHVLNVMSIQRFQTFRPWQPQLSLPTASSTDDGVRRSLLLPWDVMFVEQTTTPKDPDAQRQDAAAAAASPVAELLAQKKLDKSFRMGSLTIHHLGSLPLQEDWLRSPCVQGLFNESYIYPHHYRSSRIHWSMLQPRPQRSLYDFEVLLKRDFDGLSDRTVRYVSQSLALTSQLVLCWSRIALALESRQALGDEMRSCFSILRLLTGTNYALDAADADGSSFSSEDEEFIRLFSAQSGLGAVEESQLLFRLVCMDNPSHPIYSDSIQTLYFIVLFAVNRINRSGLLKRGAERRSDAQHAVYGLNAHQFFGLGIPFVRHAIELLPESAATMVDLTSAKGSEVAKTFGDILYRPSYVLPTAVDIDRLRIVGQQDLNSSSKLRGSRNENRSACSRAEVVQVREHSDPSQVRSLTRILTKMVEQPVVAADEDKVQIPESQEEDEEANIQNTRLKYYEMSQAYLRQPDLKLRVQRSGIHGYGLFAQMSFEKNDVIVEYIGEKIRQVVADKREAMYEQEGVGSCYLFRLDKDDIIDATRTGGMARFINHCCEPNAYAKVVATDWASHRSFFGSSSVGSGEHDGESGASAFVAKHITILAARDIQEGEEITYDYKFPIEENKLRCYCGARSCQGSMN